MWETIWWGFNEKEMLPFNTWRGDLLKLLSKRKSYYRQVMGVDGVAVPEENLWGISWTKDVVTYRDRITILQEHVLTYPVLIELLTSEPRADAVSSLTMLANNAQVLETKCEEKSSLSLRRLFLTGSTTMTSIFSRTSRKLVIPEMLSSLCDAHRERTKYSFT